MRRGGPGAGQPGAVPRGRGARGGDRGRSRAPVPPVPPVPGASRARHLESSVRGKAVSPTRGGAIAGRARSEPHLRTPVLLPRGSGLRRARRLLPRSATGVLASPRCRAAREPQPPAAPGRLLTPLHPHGAERAQPGHGWRPQALLPPASPRCQCHAQEGGGGCRLQTPRGDPPGRGPVLHQNFHHCPHH